MKVIIFLTLLALSTQVQASIIYHESWEWTQDIITGPTLDSLFGGKNNCNTGDCESSCTGGCCNELPEIDNYAVMTIAQGSQWTLGNHTFTVPPAVDGNRVFRAYAPDCSPNSPYRCNAANNRIRSGLSTSESSPINSASDDRWIGFAIWIDPERNLQGMDRYETTSIASLHSPSSHPGAGPLKMIIRKNYWHELVWEFHASFDSKTAKGLETGGCVDNSRSIPGGYHCAYRPVTLAWVDPDLAPNHNKDRKSILFQPGKDAGHWVYFVVHYKWDNTGSGKGILEIWMKRGNESGYTKVVNQRSYVGLMTNDAPYLKMGLSAIDGDACPHLQYYDNLTIGDRHSSFDEVNPSTASPAPPRSSNQTAPNSLLLLLQQLNSKGNQ